MKPVDPYKELTLEDLTRREGLVFDFGDEFDEDSVETLENSDAFDYSEEDGLAKFANLNLSDNLDKIADPEAEKIAQSPGLNFQQIKLRMVDIAGDKVKKWLRKEGEGDVIPENALVTVRYSGYFENTEDPFASSHSKRRPEKFRVGDEGDIIIGLQLAIQTMKKNEISIFWIHYDLAYGAMGIYPTYPPKANVIFIVQLLDFLDDGNVELIKALSAEERNQFDKVEKFSKHILTTAANNFKKKQIKRAIQDYKRVIEHLENSTVNDEDEQRRKTELLSKAYQNLAICYNKEDEMLKACKVSEKVSIKSAKSLYQHGKALRKLGEYSDALEKLKLANRMNPNNPDIQKEIKLVNKLFYNYLEIEKKFCRESLEGKSTKPDEKEEEIKQLAKEFCTEFMENTNVVRQAIPEGFSAKINRAIHNQAVSMGVSVIAHELYNKKIYFLQKPNSS